MSALSLELIVLGLIASATPLGVGAVLVVCSGGRTRNGITLILGWQLVLASMAVVSATVLRSRLRPDNEPSRAVAIIMIGLGIASLVGAFIWRARARQRAGADTASAPSGRSWQDRLSGAGPGTAMLAGIALAPYPIAIAAGSEIVQTDANAGARWLALLLFCVVATWSMIAATIALAWWPDTVGRRVDAWLGWIRSHSTALLFWILVVVGVWSLWRGTAVLTRL